MTNAPVDLPEADKPRIDCAPLLEAVWGRTSALVERRLGHLELIVSYLFERPLSPHEVATAIELAGSAATQLGVLGLSVGADLMRKVADALDAPELGVEQAISLSTICEDARVAVATAAAEIRLVEQNRDPIAIIGSDSELVDVLVWISLAQGIPVIRHADSMVVPETRARIVGVVAVPSATDAGHSRSIVRTVREVYPMEPVVLVAQDDDLQAIATLAHSVTTIVSPSIHPLEIIGELRAAVIRSQHSKSLALLGSEAAPLGSHLAERGFEVVHCSSAEELFEAAATDRCRGVVVGGELPYGTAMDILRLVRSSRLTRSTVFVMVSSQASPARAHAALRAGADLYLPDNVDYDDLSVWTRSILDRRSEREPIDEGHDRVQLLAWKSAMIVIERMLMVSFRRNHSVGFGLIKMPLVRTDSGKTVDEQLANEFRNEDVVSRIDNDHVLVVLQGVTERIMLRRLQDLYRSHGLQDFDARASIVEFPAHGRSLDELLTSAHQQLLHAEEVGGPAIVGSNWHLEATGVADILMVDPDETLGNVIAATFQRRGLRVEVESDAMNAMDHLTGVAGLPLPRLVLLELDLLGLDGLQFLRSLREAGAMKRFKVVVLTARARESDLRQAFDLGVDDYVQKPFSTPLLLHRVARLLES